MQISFILRKTESILGNSNYMIHAFLSEIEGFVCAILRLCQISAHSYKPLSCVTHFNSYIHYVRHVLLKLLNLLLPDLFSFNCFPWKIQKQRLCLQRKSHWCLSDEHVYVYFPQAVDNKADVLFLVTADSRRKREPWQGVYDEKIVCSVSARRI